jgi:hypothetical protein
MNDCPGSYNNGSSHCMLRRGHAGSCGPIPARPPAPPAPPTVRPAKGSIPGTMPQKISDDVLDDLVKRATVVVATDRLLAQGDTYSRQLLSALCELKASRTLIASAEKHTQRATTVMENNIKTIERQRQSIADKDRRIGELCNRLRELGDTDAPNMAIATLNRRPSNES